MYHITVARPINLGVNGTLEPGRYVMENGMAAELALRFPRAGLAVLGPAIHWPGTASGNREWLVCGGLQFGDALMLTPVLRALKAQNPNINLSVACLLHNRAALLNLPYIDGYAEWPLREKTFWRFASIIFLEGFMERADANEAHQSEVFARQCGVTVTDWRADYRPTDAERDWAMEKFPRVAGRRRIGIQLQASVRHRTYPLPQTRIIIGNLLAAGWEVYCMGAPSEIAVTEQGHIHNLALHAPTFRESAAFLLTCDCFLGPDSGFLHVAGALNVPAIGLFAAFPWQHRTAHYPSVHALQGSGACAPCHYSPSALQPSFPVGGPCVKSGQCDVLAGITPERIMAKLERLAPA